MENENNNVQTEQKEKLNANMCFCSTCGASIAKSAKSCPSCGARTKKPIYKNVFFWIVIVIALVITISIISSMNIISSELTKTIESEQEETTAISLSDFELCAEYAVAKLRTNLKNPGSLMVHSLYGVEAEDNTYYFCIDYSAENGFGGMNRDKFYLHASKGEEENTFSNYAVNGDVFGERNQASTATEYIKASANGCFKFDVRTYRIIPDE